MSLSEEVAPLIVDIERLLPRVSKPARYTGGELNSIVKPWAEGRDAARQVRVALIYPDVYDIGMSNLGLMALYDIVNRLPYALAERAFAPWPDMEALLRTEGAPVFSLESKRSLADFDLLGFSLSYELTYTNILNMLDVSGLPVFAAERRDDQPLVIAGGSGALNPDALSDFIDAFALGDGEELIVEIVDLLREWKSQGGGPRRELLRRLARLPGVYVPSLYDVQYHADGTVRCIAPREAWLPRRVVKRFVQALPPALTRPIVPYLQTVHDRAAIEIQRGCTQGCRFCQAGIIYRPRLERSADDVVRAAREMLANTGYDELSLVSLSTTDHSQIVPMAERLRREFGERLTISLPSMRVDSFSVRVAEAVSSRGKHGITFAPEAGSERLRFAINKLVREEDLFRAAENAFSKGWSSVKMYFMVGLPTETMEDVDGIVRLGREVKKIGQRHHGGRARVRVSTSNFIPKAHTPFQWAKQMTAEELTPRHQHLQRELKRAGVAFSWEEPEQSLLEAVMSKGDRRLGRAVYRAWQLGARFDAWSEYYDWPRWRRALEESGLDPSFYAHREPDLFETFPWSHIDIGVTESYLRGEWLKTLRGQTTQDCAPHKGPYNCNVCGVQNAGADQCVAEFQELAEHRRALKAASRGEPLQLAL
jgi:radical SAM family uncharacterized protein